MQEKEHTVYVYRMIKLLNDKEVRTLFNWLDTRNNTNDLMIKFSVSVTLQ